MPDFRHQISTAIQSLPGQPLKQAATSLLDTLGYTSDKTLDLGDSSPPAFLNFIQQHNPDASFDQKKALFSDWVSADLLFQLTDEDLSPESTLFQETEVKPGLLRSYLFFAIQLNGDSAVNGSYARGKLTAIARQINRAFPMPVMLLIRHPEQGTDVLSIAVINRRVNRREAHIDVLGKVTIIRDISLTEPHRGHLDILDSFALQNLVHPEKKPIHDFDTLHAAWEEIFNVELLNKRFYKELANWYFWALPQVDFPADSEPEDEKRRATGLIRLLTRLIFCWFIKEKGLVPEKLFHPIDLENILKDFDPTSDSDSSYYHAILQNLFFATLNQRMGKPNVKDAKPYRQFALDEGFLKNKSTYDVNNLYRYESAFADDPDTALTHFADIPFLNGGLFECLDRSEEGSNKKLYIDGFSRNANKRPHIPNYLFFSDEIKGVDLSDTYGDKKRKKESVSGLIRILNRYKFTIVENTPIDQEIALDPELLGKVFENLLASYNEETKTTARKQTGSFYTPRPIVDYMVDESLKAHLAQALVEKAGMKREDAEVGLELLFQYRDADEKLFSDSQLDTLIHAIDEVKILDPACGSGAFPMGVLHKLVFILTKLDPGNTRWKQRQLDAAATIPDSTAREVATAAIEDAFDNNEDDYGRKLYLIENCLYGVDIQPIAIQISKLRFFISLICDQKTNRSKKDNHGVRPLPNLETKFVAADTLIGLPEMDESLLIDPRVNRIEREIESLYHRHFSVQRRDQKLAIQNKVRSLRKELGDILSESLMAPAKAQHVAQWDPFDPQASSDFFDPFWMFGIFSGKKTTRDFGTVNDNLSGIIDDELTASKVENEGFDIVIGNPPYVQIQKFPAKQKAIWQAQGFQTYAATADIYCLFYERGAQLLKQGGSLVYITSNKWMRAGYGEKLRRYLSTTVDTESVLDFGMAQNFGAATTYTCITRFYNQQPDDRILSCYASDDRAAMADPASYFTENAVVQPNLSAEPWVVLTKQRQKIKSLVEAQGTPLKDWDIQINYGIKTGFNDAFYLTTEQRNALIDEEPNARKLLFPRLRGRNIKRYAPDWDNQWLLFIPWHFPLHEDSTISGNSQTAETEFKKQYPVTYKHLEGHKKKLTMRNRAETNIRYEWYALQRWASSYWREFNQPKIIYPESTQQLPFFFDSKGKYFIDKTCFIIRAKLYLMPFLTGTLNSTIFRYCFRDNFPEILGNSCGLAKIFLEKIHIKKPTPQQADLFAALVPLIQFAKADGQSAAYAFLEDLIDACVMECYFRDHMAEHDLLFLDQLAPTLQAYDPDADAATQRQFLESFLTTHNAPTAKIRNQLLRLTADSPNLLAIIKQEGKV
ncbi:MAG: Eco57I restriction-modification methylase domain-containing protein [Akkermansiaceae bacterium]|nr:Eco57I restriction-modification methylase domain-containing protein [Akkermansiaceae bacterium]